MTFRVLATDYDGTIATHGVVDPATLESLYRLKEAGHHVILVTGRELDELRTVFPEMDLCTLIVAENGALLYRPNDGTESRLAAPPPPEFVQRLRQRGVEPLSVGRCIVATIEPHDRVALEEIKALGLELQIIFNKGSVMVLPTGVNKATGLEAALAELGIEAAEVVGAGDAENDHPFLRICGCSVAVANALPSVKQHATIVTDATHGAGVREVIDRWLADGLRSITSPSSAVAAIIPGSVASTLVIRDRIYRTGDPTNQNAG